MNDPNTSDAPGAGHPPSQSGTLRFDKIPDTQLSQYVAILRRRKWWILGAALFGILIALGYSLAVTPLYRAAATLQIERESANVTGDIEGIEPSVLSGNEFYQTQYGLLQSRAVAMATARRLRLADDPDFLTGYSSEGTGEIMQASRQQRLDRAASIVEAGTTVTPVRNSGLVNVSYESPDPEIAAKIPNAIAESHIELNLERRFAATGYAREALETELAKIRQQLEESERRAIGYAGREELIEINRQTDLEGRTTGQSLSEIDLDVLNRELAQARAARIEAQARLDASRRRGASSEALADPAIAELRTRIAELEAKYAAQLAIFKPEYPAMVALRQQIEQLEAAESRRVSSVSDTLDAAYRSARQREGALQASVNRLKDQILNQNQRRIQYNIYQRDADTNRALYESLLERYKEIGVAGGIGINNIALVDQAEVPASPFSPNLLANLLLGLLGGLFGGIGLAFALDQLNDKIASPTDLEQALGLPLLGTIPPVDVDDPFEELQNRISPLSEAYLAVQTSLGFSTSEGVPAIFSVTSANQSEGKSTTSLALAVTLARLGKRVLLIDSDMRNPSVHKLLATDNRHGLVELLTGHGKFEDVVRSTEFERLDVISAGPIPPNPADLLSGESFAETLKAIHAPYDHVVIDSPPVLGLSDAPLIASAVDATVFVIAANSTAERAAVGSLRRLYDARAKVLGAVLTKFESRAHGYSYNYEYEYGQKRGRLLSR
ncbi:MAG: polysaccharide biosynthesis tyrosine autokinase [Sphingomonadaceae bacterium]